MIPSHNARMPVGQAKRRLFQALIASQTGNLNQAGNLDPTVGQFQCGSPDEPSGVANQQSGGESQQLNSTMGTQQGADDTGQGQQTQGNESDNTMSQAGANDPTSKQVKQSDQSTREVETVTPGAQAEKDVAAS